MKKIGKLEAYDNLITEKNAEDWAKWCGGSVILNNGNIEVEFINKYNTPQTVKVGGVILRYRDSEGKYQYIGTSTENLTKARKRTTS